MHFSGGTADRRVVAYSSHSPSSETESTHTLPEPTIAIPYVITSASGDTGPVISYSRHSAAVIGWPALVPFTLLLILAFDGVRPSLWGGFLLNILLAVIGIGFGLPLGIFFALGRASSFPAIRLVSAAVIELTRGGPLLAWLFISRFVLPDFLPDALNTDPVVNAIIVVVGLCVLVQAVGDLGAVVAAVEEAVVVAVEGLRRDARVGGVGVAGAVDGVEVGIAPLARRLAGVFNVGVEGAGVEGIFHAVTVSVALAAGEVYEV